MNTKTSVALVIATAFWLLASASTHAQILTYDFNNLVVGDLVGQDSWTLASGAGQSPDVRDYQSTIGSGLGVGQGNASSTLVASAARDFGNFGLTGSEILTLEFDYYTASGTRGLAFFGIGDNAASVVPAVFGNTPGGTNTAWMIRAQGNGTIYNALDSNGVVIGPQASKLYRVRSVWDLSANSGAGAGSLFIKNVTDGDTSFTQLFFDQAQTVSTVSLGITENYANFSSVYLRLPVSNSFSQIDNLSVVPEPSSFALVVAGLASFVALHRRRVTSALH